jgi:hypothetical protein
MRFLLFLLALPCLGQVITPAYPGVSGSTSVFAGEGDLTFCQSVAVKGTAPAFTLTCRKAGATYFTATVIKSSGNYSSGDLSWLFNWDVTNPLLVKVQASSNVRDTTLLSASLATVTGEFQIGETVTSGAKTGVVTHWSHTVGTVVMDASTQPMRGAQITLGNLSGAFAAGDVLTGVSSGATGTIDGVSPITSNKLLSAFNAQWSGLPGSIVARAWRATLGRIF